MPTRDSNVHTARISNDDWAKIMDTGLTFSAWVRQVVNGRDNYEVARIRGLSERLRVPLDVLLTSVCEWIEEGKLNYNGGLEYMEYDLSELKEVCERQDMDVQEGIDMCVKLMED